MKDKIIKCLKWYEEKSTIAFDKIIDFIAWVIDIEEN